MSTLWIDASIGIAGDMLLAALVDAGADADGISAALRSVVPDQDWTLGFQTVRRGGFRALHLAHGVQPSPHAHRPWADIRERLTDADLPERARRWALDVYGRLAHAEARMHGVDPDTVELHEVGATDSILDVVGVCVALDQLDVSRIVATPLPLGTGSVHTAHGEIPLPAPATLEVLMGWPVVPSRWPGEWVTPTGAALVAALAEPGGPPAGVPSATGFGAGTRDPDFVANVVRVLLLDGYDAPEGDVEELTANIDDMPGEHVPALIDALLDAGALDAWATPIVMKKGRPALTVSALAQPGQAEALAEVLLRHSPTLGVRWNARARRVLERWETTVDTPYGTIRIKHAGRGGWAWKAKPEHADVARCAREHGVPLGTVHRAALRALEDTP